MFSAAAPVRDSQLLPVVKDASDSPEPDNHDIHVEHSSVLDDDAVTDIEQLQANVDQQLLPVVQDASESPEPDNPGINRDQPTLQDCCH